MLFIKMLTPIWCIEFEIMQSKTKPNIQKVHIPMGADELSHDFNIPF